MPDRCFVLDIGVENPELSEEAWSESFAVPFVDEGAGERSRREESAEYSRSLSLSVCVSPSIGPVPTPLPPMPLTAGVV